MGDTCGTTECSGTTRLYNTSRWCADIQKCCSCYENCIHTTSTTLQIQSICQAKHTSKTAHVQNAVPGTWNAPPLQHRDTLFAHDPRRGISSPQPMLANAQPQTAVHKREPFATTKAFGKKSQKKKRHYQPTRVTHVRNLPHHKTGKTMGIHSCIGTVDGFMHLFQRWSQPMFTKTRSPSFEPFQNALTHQVLMKQGVSADRPLWNFCKISLCFQRSRDLGFENRDMVAK